MKILIVDDSAFTRKNIKSRLIGLPIEKKDFFEACSGLEAIETFKKERPIMMILDLLMPGLSGEDTLRMARVMKIPCFIVIHSSNFQKPVRERLMTFGANLFLEKPINDEQSRLLTKRFLEFIEDHGLTEEL
ncbi:MAG: response regulator [Deltaproteobacteria bacterium]|nr:response regulator [Deltaproteobacteria bacterium]